MNPVDLKVTHKYSQFKDDFKRYVLFIPNSNYYVSRENYYDNQVYVYYFMINRIRGRVLYSMDM